MNNSTKQINEATNQYVRQYNETLPKIRHIIMNPEEYDDDAQLAAEISTLINTTTAYAQEIAQITGIPIIENNELVSNYLRNRPRPDIED